jgi:uncharacterized membrane protein YraQ (UPF0718 family)
MEVSILILGSLVIALGLIAYARGGPALPLAGLRVGADVFFGVAPQLVLGFMLAGLVTVLIPSDLVASLLGEESGLRGVVIASIAGILTPGGPYLQFPLVAALSLRGAGVGPVAAYLTAWSLLGANRALVWEIPVLGPAFTAARWIISLSVPILVGTLLPFVLRYLQRLG